MNKTEPKLILRIPDSIDQEMQSDLKRSHPFAFERVGFLFSITKTLKDNTTLVLATKYIPVDDQDYIQDTSVGACIGSTAIRKAMQQCFDNKWGCFHVHLHNHNGMSAPSSTDQRGIPPVVESFSNISAGNVNGFLILSKNSIYAKIKIRGIDTFFTPSSITVVGYPMRFQFGSVNKTLKNKTFDRQSFLGTHSVSTFENVKVAIVGYGGGGSHIGQQLAHLGILNVKIFDNDIIETSNMNRLIGGWFADVKKGLLKVAIGKRTIKNILPFANPEGIITRWQENPELLQICDVVFGAVDSYAERQQLEAECRRYLIPYIDIGMDVHANIEKTYSMAGQIILSIPGKPCMNCMGFLTNEKLAIEAAKYGKTGGNPQVVWPNGVLASTAVGIFVDLVTGWANQNNNAIYLSYDGNTGNIIDHVRVRFTPKECSHYNLIEIGPVKFKNL